MRVLLFALALMQQPSSGVATIAQGSQSAIEERREAVVRTLDDWQSLWKAHGGADVAPAIDFTKEMVVALFAGIRPTGGYRVEITAARREGPAVIVDYAERRPGADDIVSQALTSPFHIIRLPRHEGPVSFRSVAVPSPR